ncbi:hypothetical protein P4H66_13965 [Paenibacillus dokdonensis]|uniref:Uncharacterized protein n=1 Tax=Paenibacillus dokdonensis TaxID=2567944 RepID=A0ABU6GMH5_9BACL|nr:hypothetical protein [Paenibacillus dokdonensis]MEC0240954.1 hypothetical protein [Paenibacillus dokdonensis]
MMMIAAALSIALMCGFYFAVAYFGIKFFFKKVLHRSVDPMLLMGAIVILAFCVQIMQRLWYHQPMDATLLLPPVAGLSVILRRVRSKSRQK